MAKNEPKNTIIFVLNELQNGHCVNDLSTKLEEVIAAVKNRNASGELTLKLKLKPRNGGKSVDLEHTITTKLPKEPTPTTFFYVTEANNLQRNDPDQRVMDLRELPKEDAEPLRTVAV